MHYFHIFVHNIEQKKQLYLSDLKVSSPKPLSGLMETIHDVIITSVSSPVPRVIASAAQVIVMETTVGTIGASARIFNIDLSPVLNEHLGDPATALHVVYL